MRKIKPYIFLAILLLWGCSKVSETVVRNTSENEARVEKLDERAQKLNKIKDSVVPFFTPMGEPEEYDWLSRFNEAGQTFEEYVNGNPTLPTDERRVIYIQPIGEFTLTQHKALKLVADYMSDFYNLPVKLNDTQRLGDVPTEMRRNLPSGERQVKTAYFLENLLPAMLPSDAAAFLCFTNEDLYPGDDWYFVFGQATLEKRVGVWSLSRLGKPEKSVDEYKKFLARTLKIAMHETGHMFTMLHCKKYECLMSGSNHLGETDRRPLDVCPECMAKIAWSMNYEPAIRYRNLAEFWQKQGWKNEVKTFEDKALAVEKNKLSK